jgi:hypothetical protein
MEDWRLFQDINSYKLQAMGKEAYVESMLADWRKGDVRMRDFKSTAEDAYLTPGKETWLKEGVLKDEDRARQIIEDTWEHVTHPGSGLDPGVTTKETMADKYNKRRVIEYPTAESYLRFSDQYGIGRANLGHGFLNHTEQMARDLGMARMLGGDPDREAQTLITWALSSKKINANQAKHLEMLYSHASGQSRNRPTSPPHRPDRARGCRRPTCTAPSGRPVRSRLHCNDHRAQRLQRHPRHAGLCRKPGAGSR